MARAVGHTGRVLWASAPDPDVQALMRLADAEAPEGEVTIRGERTSDGATHENYTGRVVAVRERGQWTRF